MGNMGIYGVVKVDDFVNGVSYSVCGILLNNGRCCF